MMEMDMDQGTTDTASAVIGHPTAENAALEAPLINVNAFLFRAALECRSFEEVRYYINGVYVQPHPERGALLVATDGHRLICIHDETAWCREGVIVTLDKNAFVGMKTGKTQPEIPRLIVDGKGIATLGTYRSVRSALIDGSYPDYPRVLLPMVSALKEGKFIPASLNHEYLASFSRIASMICKADKAVRLVSTSESDAVLILFQGAPHAFGVLMPIRSSLQNGLPAFIRPVLEPTPQPAAKEEPPAKRVRKKNNQEVREETEPSKDPQIT